MKPMRGNKTTKASLTTVTVAQQALKILADDYNAGRPATTYGELARRCGYAVGQNVQWMGQVTQLIDIACALADVPSFALVRVCTKKNGKINDDSWRTGEYADLRNKIIARAQSPEGWTDDDFERISNGLAYFSAHALGNKKAWAYVRGQINVEDWARGPR